MFSIHNAASLFYYTGRGDSGHELIPFADEKAGEGLGTRIYYGDAKEGPLAARATWAGHMAANLGLARGSAVNLSQLAALWYGYAPDGRTPLNKRVASYSQQTKAQQKVAEAEVELFSALREMRNVREGAERMGLAPRDMTDLAEVKACQQRIDAAAMALDKARKSPHYRTNAHDLTFSAPKSVSILFASLLAQSRRTGDPNAEGAGKMAETLQMLMERSARRVCEDLIEKDLVFTRHGSGSNRRGAKRTYENVKGLAFALVQHFESRPTVDEAAKEAKSSSKSSGKSLDYRMPDPQLHVHALMMALGQDFDDETRAIWTRYLATNAKAIGAAFRAELAAGLRAEGFLLRQSETDKVDAFELADISDEQIACFSARRAVVEKAMQSGLTAQQGAQLDRHAKRDYSTEEILEAWDARIMEAGVPDGLALQRQPSNADAPRSRKAIAEQAIDSMLAMASGITLVDISRKAHELAQHATLDELAGDTPLEWARKLQNDILSHPDIRVGSLLDKHGLPIFTTKKLQDREKELYFQYATDLAKPSRQDGLSHQEAMDVVAKTEARLAKLHKVSAFKFADFQKDLVAAMLTSKESVRVALAPAGCGKTTAALAACRGFESNGMRFFPMAPSNAAAKRLASDLQKNQSEGLTPQRLLGRIEKNRLKLTSKDVLFVDEASMLDFDTAEGLVKAALAAKGGPARIIFMGDIEQLPSVGRGNFLRRLIEDNDNISKARGSKPFTTRVIETPDDWEKITRQKRDIGKQATAYLALRKNREALAIYESLGAVELFDSREDASRQLVLDYVDGLATQASHLSSASGQKDKVAALHEFQQALRSRAIIASTRSDVARLNALSRDGLEKLGYFEKAGLQRETMRRGKVGTMEIRQGERVILTEALHASLKKDSDGGARSEKLSKSTIGTVLHIQRKGKQAQITLALDGSEPRQIASFSVEDFSGIDYAYATTVHKAQGATVDKTYELFGRFASSELDYVAKSRWREDHRIYGARHEYESYKQAISRSTEKQEALDLGIADLSAFALAPQALDKLVALANENENDIVKLKDSAKAARARHLTQGVLLSFGEEEQEDGSTMPFAEIEIAGAAHVFRGQGLLDRLDASRLPIGSHVGLEAFSPEAGNDLSGISWRWHTKEALSKAGLLSDEASIGAVAHDDYRNVEEENATAELSRARDQLLSGEKSSLMSNAQKAALYRIHALESLRASADLIQEIANAASEAWAAKTPKAEAKAEEQIPKKALELAAEWLPRLMPRSRSEITTLLAAGSISARTKGAPVGQRSWLAHHEGIAFAKTDHGIEAWPVAHLSEKDANQAQSRSLSLDTVMRLHNDAMREAQAEAASMEKLASSISPELRIEAIEHPTHGICLVVGARGWPSASDVVREMFQQANAASGSDPEIDQGRGIAIRNTKTHQVYDSILKGYVFPMQDIGIRLIGANIGARRELPEYLSMVAEKVKQQQSQGEARSQTTQTPRPPLANKSDAVLSMESEEQRVALCDTLQANPSTPHVNVLLQSITKREVSALVVGQTKTAVLIEVAGAQYVAPSNIAPSYKPGKLPKHLSLKKNRRGELELSTPLIPGA